MSNEFCGTGNIAIAPTLKTVSVSGKPRRIAELRVFFDDYRLNDDGTLEQKGGFWMDVSVWREHLADMVVQHLRKGTRVHVTGRLSENRWNSQDTGEERHAMQLQADNVYLSLGRIEDVSFKAKRDENSSQNAQSS